MYTDIEPPKKKAQLRAFFLGGNRFGAFDRQLLNTVRLLPLSVVLVLGNSLTVQVGSFIRQNFLDFAAQKVGVFLNSVLEHLFVEFLASSLARGKSYLPVFSLKEIEVGLLSSPPLIM